MASELHFPNWAWTRCRQIPISYFIGFSMNLSSQSQNFRTLRTLILGAQKTKERDPTTQITKRKSNIMMFCGRQCCGMSILLQGWSSWSRYLSSSTQLRHVISYMCLAKCCLRQDNACTHIIRAICSHLHERSLNPLIRGYGPAAWATRSHDVASLDFLPN